MAGDRWTNGERDASGIRLGALGCPRDKGESIGQREWTVTWDQDYTKAVIDLDLALQSSELEDDRA